MPHDTPNLGFFPIVSGIGRSFLAHCLSYSLQIGRDPDQDLATTKSNRQKPQGKSTNFWSWWLWLAGGDWMCYDIYNDYGWHI